MTYVYDKTKEALDDASFAVANQPWGEWTDVTLKLLTAIEALSEEIGAAHRTIRSLCDQHP